MRVNKNLYFLYYLRFFSIDFTVIHHQLLMNIIKHIHQILYQNRHLLKKFQFLFQYQFQLTVKKQHHQIKQKFIDVDNVHMYLVLKYKIDFQKKSYFQFLFFRNLIGRLLGTSSSPYSS